MISIISIIVFIIMFIVGIALLIRAIVNYQKDKEINQFMCNYLERQKANMEYWKLYNECKKKQEKLDE